MKRPPVGRRGPWAASTGVLALFFLLLVFLAGGGFGFLGAGLGFLASRSRSCSGLLLLRLLSDRRHVCSRWRGRGGSGFRLLLLAREGTRDHNRCHGGILTFGHHRLDTGRELKRGEVE